MADDAALRKRRQRAHRAGDHSLCRPESCSEAAGIDPREVAAVIEANAGAGAKLLRDAGYSEHDPVTARILVEIAFAVDVLEHLRLVIGGDLHTWSHLAVGSDGGITVRIDNTLQETRQWMLTLRALVAEFRAARPAQESKVEAVQQLDDVRRAVLAAIAGSATAAGVDTPGGDGPAG